MHRLAKQLVLALLSASTISASAGECTVAVASNFAGAMRAIVSAFEASHDHEVTLSFGSSGKFFAQISNGAPFDVFLSADEARVDALDAHGLSVTDSRFTYAIGRLALWSSELDLPTNGRERLLHGQYNRLALANPRLAPYGRAAVEVLNALGIAQSSRAKWVMGENVAQAYAFVHSGNAELGFVAASQLIRRDDANAKGSVVWRIDSSLHAPIRQDAVLLKHAEHNIAARDLLAFLRSNKAARIITSFGYDSAEAAPEQPSMPLETGASA